jgi:hypothetical protein
LRERAEGLLAQGERRFLDALAKRSLTPEEEAAIAPGSWSVGLVIDPPKPSAAPDRTTQNVFLSSNPQYTGWPVWVDSRGFSDKEAHPKVRDKGWESLIITLGGFFSHVDFWRIDPKGELYLRRVLQDDLSEKTEPGTSFDPGLAIYRVADAIATGLAVAKGAGWDPATSRLGFAFRWTKLSHRELRAWASPSRLIMDGHEADDDEVTTFVEVPLETPATAIAPFVDQATRDLFVIFDGMTIPPNTIEALTQRLLTRAW